MKFELNEKEVELYNEFMKKLPKKYKSMTRQFIFHEGNGIGIGITIKVGDKEKNITDYSSW
jgi:hypothetical protein